MAEADGDYFFSIELGSNEILKKMYFGLVGDHNHMHYLVILLCLT